MTFKSQSSKTKSYEFFSSSANHWIHGPFDLALQLTRTGRLSFIVQLSFWHACHCFVQVRCKTVGCGVRVGGIWVGSWEIRVSRAVSHPASWLWEVATQNGEIMKWPFCSFSCMKCSLCFWMEWKIGMVLYSRPELCVSSHLNRL